MESYKGYKLNKKEKLEVIDSVVEQLVHEKSGATIVLIKNSDQARSFMAGFRTPPYDDTGLFHIFEHSVLEGSRLYPSKSNFFHVANSTVASFVNAMTGPVYTLYPFVSRSEKDFENLTSTYLDAVFFPKVLTDPRIVKREGWRYEVDENKKDMSINGVVFSEMKGAFASPYRSVLFQFSREMVPDTPFSYSSGGLPEKIATLTFKQIQDAHKKYYHPQNSVIYYYGDLDFKKALSELDKNFLSHFEKTKDYQPPEITKQKDITYSDVPAQGTYPGTPGENKDFVTKGYLLGAGLTSVEESVSDVLIEAIVSNSSAPVKTRVQKDQLAQSVYATSVGQDNAVALIFEGSSTENKVKIDAILVEEFKKASEEGVDQKLLQSILNRYEFSYKEKNSNSAHRGMSLGSVVLQNWLYNDEPLSQSLDFVTHFKSLREKLFDPALVKQFVKTHFVNNKRTRWMFLKPDSEFSEKFNKGLDIQVEQALKKEGIEHFAEKDEVYQKWVKEKEPQEILDKIPLLKLSDIKADESALPYDVKNEGGTEVLTFKQATNGISYISMEFDLKGVPESQIKYLEVLRTLLKSTDAGKFGYQELSQDIDTYLGGLSFSASAHWVKAGYDSYKPMMNVSLKFLDTNKDKALSLLKTIMTESHFTPDDRVEQLMKEVQSYSSNSVSSRAPMLSSLAATKGFLGGMGRFVEELRGGVFEQLISSSEFKAEAIKPMMKSLMKAIFNQKRMKYLSVTSSPGFASELRKDLLDLKQSLPNVDIKDEVWKFASQVDYDGYTIPGEVQYVTEVADFSKAGLKYNGAMRVYSRYLNNHYMIPKLREQLGAYGASSGFQKSGLFVLSTYRDPNLKESLGVFEKAVDYMDSEAMTSDKLKPAILGSLKPYYADRSIVSKARQMTELYIQGLSWKDYIQIKKEVLETKPEDFKKISQGLKKALKNSTKSVAGNEDKVKAEAPFLKKVLSVR